MMRLFSMLAVMLVLAGPVKSELMPTAVSQQTLYTFPGDSSVGVGGLALDADPVSGRWVVCFWTNPQLAFLLRCELYESTVNNPYTLIAANTFNPYGDFVHVDFVDVQMTPDGGYHVMVFRENGYMHVYTLDGTDLSTQQLISPSDPNNVGFTLSAVTMGIAPHSTGYWIAGVRTVSNFIHAYSFDETGAHISTPLLGQPPNGTKYCGGSTRSNASNDIMVAWVITDVSSPSCVGDVRAQIFRPDGTPVSEEIQLNLPGNAEAIETRVEADELGHFLLLASGNDHRIYTARYSVTNGLLQSLTPMNIGAGGRVGAGASDTDFAVLAKDHQSNPCIYTVQLADDGQIEPLLQRDGPQCGYPNNPFPPIYDIEVLPDGRLLLLWVQLDQFGDGTLEALMYHRPVLAEIGGMSIAEGNPGSAAPIATATVTLTGAHPTNEAVEVNYYTRSVSAIENIDYVGVSGTLVVPPGHVQSAINIPIIADDLYEDSEVFEINIDAPVNTAVRVNSDHITIVNDDVSPPIENDCDLAFPEPCRSVAEPLPNDSAQAVVNLFVNAPRDRDIYIDFATADETATAGEDYVATAGTVHIPAGGNGAEISIPILTDAEIEASETFVLQLDANASVQIAQPELRIAITEGPACLVNLTPQSAEFDHGGGNGAFDLTLTHPSCEWDLSHALPWVTVTSPLSGVGDATVTYTVDAQSGVGMFPREGELTVQTGPPANAQAFTVIQLGDPSLCDFVIDPALSLVPVAGTDIQIDVSANSVCPWEVLSPDPWVEVLAPLGPVSGDGTIQLRVEPNHNQPNQATADRSSTLNAPFSLDVQQAGCSYALPIAGANVDVGGDMLTVAVNAPDGNPGPCQWTATTHDPWIVILDGHSGSGGGAVQLDVLENPSVQSRQGSLSIGDQVFTVSQDGIACQYDLAPNPLALCPDADSAAVDVLTANGCDWSFSGLPAWLSIDSNASGIGSESSDFSSQENATESMRQASVFLDSSAQNNAAVLSVQQAGYLVFEGFALTTLPVDWQFLPDATPWSIDNQQLSGQRSGGGQAFAWDASNTSHCLDCAVEGRVTQTFLGGLNAEVGLIGWFQDPDNHIALTLNEFGNRWTLKRVRSGQVESVSNSDTDILPFQNYHVRLRWQDDTVYADIDGVNRLQLTLSHPMTPGRAGFIIEDTNAQFDAFRLVGSAASLDAIFKQGFEAPEAVIRSVCTL